MSFKPLSGDPLQSPQARARVFTVFWGLLFLLILGRLFQLQILKGSDFYALSQENMMRLKVVKAPRGVILDRNGEVLARNRPSYAVSVLYHQVKKRRELRERLLRIRDARGAPVFDGTELDQALETARLRRFEPVKLAEDVGFDVLTTVAEHTHDLPGIVAEQEIRREYPGGALACHVLGYMGEIPEEQFDSAMIRKGYSYGDYVGKFGIEAQYEEAFLHGRDGREYVMVDAHGKEIERVKEMPSVIPRPGRDLALTLDLRIQRAAEEAFPDSQSGALVAIDPRNGEILAMVSSPRFDPNVFAGSSKRRSRYWRSLIMDPRLPLNNRAASGQYPPGSTFKLATAAAGFNEGIVGEDERFRPCHGGYYFGSRLYKCWKPEGHGSAGLVKGVQVSCDVYFYQVGLKTGIELIDQYARMFGFGRKTGVDLPDEKAGEVLNPDTYNAKFKNRGWVWTEGQILNSSIGQGQVVTPVQLANYAGVLASGDVLFRPHLFRRSPAGAGFKDSLCPVRVLDTVNLRPDTKRILRDALEAVMMPGGTGGRARVEGVRVGGKTGTAQNPQGEDHALFFAVAPLDAPEIAVGVVVENAGHGGSVAAPIAGKVLNCYFNKTPAR